MRGRPMFYVRAGEVVLDAVALSSRLPADQSDRWRDHDPSARDPATFFLRFDCLGRWRFRLTQGERILVSIPVRARDVGPRHPAAGPCAVVFWKDRRLHRALLNVEVQEESRSPAVRK